MYLKTPVCLGADKSRQNKFDLSIFQFGYYTSVLPGHKTDEQIFVFLRLDNKSITSECNQEDKWAALR